MSAERGAVRAALLGAIALLAAASADARPSRMSRAFGAGELTGLDASIVYVREDAGRRQVFVARADGTSERAITSGPHDHYPADVSRDGAALAIIGASGDDEESHRETLTLVDLRGDAAPRVRASAARVRNAVFSPDGASVAFEADGTLDGVPGAFRDVFVTGARGTDAPRRLTRGDGAFEPAFAADGASVFTTESDRDGAELHRRGAGDARVTCARGDDFAPRPSPDGARLAFVSARDGEDHVYVATPDGDGARRALDGAGEERDAEWSRDGSRLALVKRGPTGDRVLVWDAVTGRVTAVARGAPGALEGPTFSPDGQYVAYTSRERDGTTDLFVARADGSAARRLFASRATRFRPRWARD